MPNQEIINFINQARVAGQTDEQIKSALLSAGWTAVEVESAFSKKSFSLESLKNKKVWLPAMIALLVFLIGGGAYWLIKKDGEFGRDEQISLPEFGNVATAREPFGSSVKHDETMNFAINPEIAQKFSINEITNLADMEKAYGFKFSEAEKKFLEENKFVIKEIPETNIRPFTSNLRLFFGYDREFWGLYETVAGSSDYKERRPANAIFLSSDIFFHSYQLLFVELLKEAENKIFFPNMKSLSEKFFNQAQEKIASAANDSEKQKWTKVRNYFALPHALLSSVALPLTKENYASNNPDQLQSDWKANDEEADKQEKTENFVRQLGLDEESQTAVLADIDAIFKAQGQSAPVVLAKEYNDYALQTKMDFKVDFSQFTPRSIYTSSSLRRQYFRAMNWYIQTPFFLESKDLTTYAFGISQLLAENEQDLKNYSQMEAAINYLVGTSDDLMPVDYLSALSSTKGQADQEKAVLEYLRNARQPQIKSLTANLPTVGQTQSADLLNATKGMRFFSGKFIIDSYWTGYLTQGDEAPRPGYDQKLPPMASSLEVMSLLGSDYAKEQIKKLDFYKPDNSRAIDRALNELAQETQKLDDNYWQSNIYNGWLWTIKSLFGWQKENSTKLPEFMQAPNWAVKTLMTGSAFWTELRHATLLYAKQSFAELGGGPGDCDDRQIPPPPKGYIEPQWQAYKRLQTLAKRTQAGYKDMGFELSNLYNLDSFVNVMNDVLAYTEKELINATLAEKTKTENSTYMDGRPCVQYSIDGDSDWEILRVRIVAGLADALPFPAEGSVLPAKDKRTAIVADVHTGQDSNNPAQILYEGVGPPKVIFVAVKDTNGPRLTVGFTYSHYETRQPYGGQRMTDEDWQKNFYNENEPYGRTNMSLWPQENFWYAPILNVK